MTRSARTVSPKSVVTARTVTLRQPVASRSGPPAGRGPPGRPTRPHAAPDAPSSGDRPHGGGVCRTLRRAHGGSGTPTWSTPPDQCVSTHTTPGPPTTWREERSSCTTHSTPPCPATSWTSGSAASGLAASDEGRSSSGSRPNGRSGASRADYFPRHFIPDTSTASGMLALAPCRTRTGVPRPPGSSRCRAGQPERPPGVPRWP